MAVSFPRPDPESSPIGSFRVVRRGFDPDEVRSRLQQLLDEIDQSRERERALEREFANASRPSVAVDQLDREVLVRLVGEETERLLGDARDEAGRIRARAEDEAVQLVAAAYDEAARVRESVQEEVTYLQRVTAEQVETELASARGRGLEMVTEAREYREKVLSDLAQRRDLAREQIRALIDGRDHLLRAFEVARLAAVDIIVELEQAAPSDDPSAPEQFISRQSAESAIYDADDDITPVNGIEMPNAARGDTAAPEYAAPVHEGSEQPDAGAGPVGTTVGAATPSAGDTPSTPLTGMAPDRFVARRTALAPLTEALVKQFKRVVVDEQNDVLTAIRRTERVNGIAEVLPDEDSHVARYRSCSLAEVADAFAAGAASMDGGTVPDPHGPSAAVLDRFAEELVLPMRERLERVIESSEGNRFELSAFVRSAYREWKQRFDGLAEELLLHAHGLGAYSVLPVGSLVVWQPDPTAPTCPEVSANAGVVTRVPDTFPSGHVHPPASASCRCMIQRLPE